MTPEQTAIMLTLTLQVITTALVIYALDALRGLC